MRRLLVRVVLIATSLAWTPLVRAQVQDPAPPLELAPPSAPREVTAPESVEPPAAAPAARRPVGARNQGLMLRLGFGAHGCTDTFCEDVDPMVYLRLSALYRLARYFGAGLHLSFMFNDPEKYGEYDITVWHLAIGPELRGIVPLGPLDVWTGIMLGYLRSRSDVELMGEPSSRTWDGFGFGWGVGLDYYVTRRLALGLNFWLYKPVYTKHCSDGDCESFDASEVVGINWNVGVSAVLWLGK